MDRSFCTVHPTPNPPNDKDLAKPTEASGPNMDHETPPDPELAELIRLWPGLSASAKTGLLAVAREVVR